MINNMSKKVAGLVLVAALVSIAIGGLFIAQAFAKADLITETMVEQKVTYGGAEGGIDGLVDTPQEAATMASILEEHRVTNLGYYTELARDDPNRQTILNAMTMENSLNLAVMGYGLTDVVKGSGAFMIIVGLTFGAIAVSSLRKGEKTS